MLSRIRVSNLGPLADVSFQPGPGLNVVLGRNASGKTMLLKVLYATQRALEEFRRGEDRRPFRSVLEDKLYWTFQTERLGAVVRRGVGGPTSKLEVEIHSEDAGQDTVNLRYSFSRKVERGVGQLEGAPQVGRAGESLFVPAKEIVSQVGIIKETRGQQKFGFDDPTYDLVRALEREPSRGRPPFGDARRLIEDLLGHGRLRMNRTGGWVYRAGNLDVPVAIAAEGHKKIGIIDRLIVNRSLTPRSLLFLDEPESFLHPQALLGFLHVLALLAEGGVQVFMATHSLFVLNGLRVYASSRARSVPVLSLAEPGAPATVADLQRGMPDNNPIVDASIRLYEMEIEGAFDG